MSMHRELTAGACALALSLFAAQPALADVKPLLQAGKKTLFQRVLTTPSCELSASVGDPKGKPLPAFSRYYVYERASAASGDWIKVGPDSFGKTTGWLRAACTVEWKMQLTLAFTNPANRDRTLFFKDRVNLEKALDAPDPVSVVAPIRQQMKTAGKAPDVLAQEPEFFIDLQKQFYLLPILSGEEVMTEGGFRTRILNVASVSSADPAQKDADAAAEAAAAAAAGKMKEFSAAVVFVIDSTISMDPYIDRTREAIKKVYQQIEREKLSKQVKFGLIAFRSNVQAVPGLEYVAKMYADPNTVKDGADFLSKVADLKQAKVSSSEFDEDAFAGVAQAIDKVDWSRFGARYIVLITDAGAIEGDNKLSSTGMNADQLRLEAANPGVAIYTLHLKTPSGSSNHARAEAQYRNLSTYAGTNTSLYYPVSAGNVAEFGAKVDALSSAIASQVKAAYMGEDAVGSALNASPSTNKQTQQMLADADLISHAMRLAYLGEKTGTKAPPVFRAWISDRDLIKQNIPTTDVRVLLTKAQLSDLSDVVKEILDAANSGMITPTVMFEKLRSVAATMGADPNQLKQGGKTTVAELGVMGEYLDGLPYRSDVLNLDEETWKSWDALSQEKFIRTLTSKLRHYQRYNADADRWVSLAKGGDARDDVYPIPLEMMP